MQLEIAWRGLQLLRAGGLMAYSTCSLNPIEDEAVVAALLQRAEAQAPGAVRLEAWPEREVLPGLLRRPGVSSWRVAEHVESDGGGGDAHGGAELRLCWHASYEDATAAGMPHALRTLWPPPPAAAASLGLERCSRLLHHDQDTGGFFIALLRKRRPLAPSDGVVVARTMPTAAETKELRTPAETYTARNCSAGRTSSSMPPKPQSAYMFSAACGNVECENVESSSGSARPERE